MYRHYKTTNHALGAYQRVFETKLDELGSQSDPRVTPRPAPPITSSDTPMIVIARHGKPALNRHIWINATQYLDWWAQYDAGGLAANQVVPNGLIQALQACKTVVSSTLRRALETAELAAPERELIVDPLFVEAPLPPPDLPDFILFRPRFWGVVSRITWFFGNHRGQESREDAEIRAKKAAEWLILEAQRSGSVGLLAHGWFNRMMRPHLLANGWVCVYDGRDSHWSHRVYRPKPN
jgi:broad specificity phosphatase PhoE